MENRRNRLHTGVTSHLCKVHSPPPRPRVHPSQSLSDEPCSASESLLQPANTHCSSCWSASRHTCSFPALGINPGHPCRKMMFVWLQAPRRCWVGLAWASGCYDGSVIIGSNCVIGVPSRYSVNVCGMNKCLCESVPAASWGQRQKDSA